MSIAAAPQASPIRFAGRRGFIRLLMKNAALSVLTLGLYRFWARTAVRRFLWNNIAIADEPLEYTGRGVELFIGFLIAAAILFPFFLVYSLLQNFVVTNRWSSGALTGAYILTIVVFTQVAIYRARRYRLSRTQWRGIACSQDGSTWSYVALSMAWSVALLLSLGLAQPWSSMSLRRYEMTHTIFGDRRLEFHGRGGDLILNWLGVYAVGAIPVMIFAGMNFELWRDLANPSTLVAKVPALYAATRGWWIFALGVPAVMLAYVAYRMAALRYVISVTRLGEVRFFSDARTRRVLLYALGLMATMLVWIALIGLLLAGAIFLGIAAAKVLGWRLPDAKSAATVLGIAGGLFVWAAVYLGYYLAKSYWLLYRVVRHVCDTLAVVNLATIETVIQAAGDRPTRGEGLADAFDVGAM